MRIVTVIMAVSFLWFTAGQIRAIELAIGDGLRAPLDVAYRFPDPVSEPLTLGSSISFHEDTGGRIVARRILSDPLHLRYFGYEALLEPQADADVYLVGFRELDPQTVKLPLGGWTLQSPAMYPPPRVMREGDTISLDVGTVPGSGDTNERIVDDVLLTRLQPATLATAIQQTDLFPVMAYASLVGSELHKRGLQPAGANLATASRVVGSNGMRPPASARVPPSISGSARLFTAADVELSIVNPGFTVNGRLAAATGLVNAVHGRLVFLYLPGKGRYILSLVPRPELGFTREGEVSGGFLKWAAEGETFSVDSTTPIAPGGGPWFVYELHDRDWQPATPPRAPSGILLGSVDPQEIASLQKDTPK